MSLHKRVLSLLLSFALVCSIFGIDTVCTYAAQNNSPTVLYLDSGDIVFDGANVKQNGQPVTPGPQDSGYLITQHDSSVPLQNTITVKSGTQNITLQNINVKPVHGYAFVVQMYAQADISLAGSNVLDTRQSDIKCAGLAVNQGSAVQISGTGSLTAYGCDAGAGIGGDATNACGTVTITGGHITAYGGSISGGAGIGSGGVNGAGSGGNGGRIRISGGVVTAYGGNNGAGIGGGKSGWANSITIGGSSIVTATGDGDGAGIGGGGYDWGGSITISGSSTVTATGGRGGAGIGGGMGGNGGYIQISENSTVTAAGGSDGSAGIGGGDTANGGSVIITNQTNVTAKGGGRGWDIGSGADSNVGGSLAVSDGAAVTMLNTDSSLNTNAVNPDTNSAPPKYTDCQIVTGSTEKTYDSNGHISGTQPVLYLDDGSITITGSGYSVGNSTVLYSGDYLIMQKNSSTAAQNTITVRDGTHNITIWNINIDVHGTNGACAFSIAKGAVVSLTLTGTNTLKSGSTRAGLEVPGDGSNPPARNGNAFLTVMAQSTGSLTATCGGDSAGIGGGCDFINNVGEPGGSITIYGGTVTAAGDSGAGIGGGCDPSGNIGSAGGNITISGGIVTATSHCGAGIGGGCGSGTGGTISIRDGTVTATSGAGAGIGGGCSMNGSIGGSTGGTTVISGGKVNTISYDYGAGIGGGGIGDGGTIHISGGIVAATGGKWGGAGIGGGSYGAGGDVTISGSNTQVTAQGKGSGYDIGSGHTNNTGGTLTVGDDRTVEPLPLVQLFSAGTNAEKPNSTTRPQFMNCVITGTGAKNASGNDLSGCYDENGKLWLNITMLAPASVVMGESATLNANVKRHYFNDWVTLPGTVQFYANNSLIGSSAITNGTAQTNWKPLNGNTYSIKAVYQPNAAQNDRYDSAESSSVSCTPKSNSSGGSSGSTSGPSLPSGLTDASTGVQADLSGAAFPSNVTSISLFVTKPVRGDRQAADFRTALLASPSTGVINIPQLCNISLLDQNGNPAFFTGTVRVKIPLPAGVRGTPHVFRFETDTQKFTDMNAVVENGYLVFSTDHFGEYAVAGVGNAIVLDTLNYQMPVNGNYQIGLRLPGTKAASVKYYSTNDKVAAVIKLKNGNYQVIGKGTGTAYIMFDVYDNKNHLLTHASVRVDVKTGIRPRGDSTRQFGIF